MTLLFHQTEAELIRLMALAHALKQAGVAQAEPPIVDTWPFPLTVADQQFLRECPYPISPA